jgi:5-(carboxyamino)imidazole ribonucleotide synthase
LNEYAMVGVRSINGDFIYYPLVETHQRNGVCRHIVGPATAFGAKSSLEVASAKICKKIAEELKIVGTFAIEFFLDPAGQLLVNEIAPRVHNTGHFTQNIFATSQFENHLLAVLGSRLIQPETPNFFAMYNFLGPDGVFGTVSAPIPKVQSNGQSNVHLHWYGKSGISPRRKLGHINFSSNDMSKRDEALLHMEQIITNWEDETRKVIPPYNMEIRL